MIDPNTSWAEKYRPKKLDDLILPDEKWRNVINEWIENKKIGGNIALFGFGGLGKSSLARILVNSIITNNSDFKLIKSRSVQEVDTIGEFIRSKPIGSPIRIILIEEADRLSKQAQNELKDKYTEQYQEHCSIIITTNYPYAIDEYLLQRFFFKLDFSRLDKQMIFCRLLKILQDEKCQVNENDLKDWIDRNSQLGMRELINKLQLSAALNNNIIVFDDVKAINDLESKVIGLCCGIIDNFLKCADPRMRKMAFVNPLKATIINTQWVELVQLVTNNYSIDFRTVLENIENKMEFLPIKIILGQYLENLNGKLYPHIHLLSCISEIMKTINEVA